MGPPFLILPNVARLRALSSLIYLPRHRKGNGTLFISRRTRRQRDNAPRCPPSRGCGASGTSIRAADDAILVLEAGDRAAGPTSISGGGAVAAPAPGRGRELIPGIDADRIRGG